MTEHEEELLMRHVDGELEPAERTTVEKLLEQSEEARALVRDFERVGHLVRAVSDEKSAGAGDIAARVLARLPAEAKPAPRRATVIAFVPALGLALAAAAAVALLIRPQPRTVAEAPSSAPPPIAALPSVAEPTAAEETAEAEPDTGAEIESVDFGAQNGSIFMVATGPQVTPVVWLSDDAPSGGRMKPL